ncbi:MAG TPA: hypothetical protein VE270_09815 [Thermoleophilaceae bacterium]|nr:hypothetical protein [Thermoleophilaceae bacterium]
MTDVERLLSEYKEAHRSGDDADPRPFLARVSGVDRELLAGLIDAYLERAPRPEFDVQAFQASPAATLAEDVQRSLAGEGGMWPALLPRLRARARLRRADLVAQLAARLGAQSQQDKVAGYYHQMEQGLLPEPGVSDTVLEALGKIVGWTAESLRKAGQMPAPGPQRTDPGAVFARTRMTAAAPEAEPAMPGGPPREQWDEVDRLFRGAPPSA